LNNIVDNVIRELEFQAGIVLGSFGLNADLKSIQNLLSKESIDKELKDACHIIFRTHFIRQALIRDDAEDACYNLIILWDHCSTAEDSTYNSILIESIDKLLKVTNKNIKNIDTHISETEHLKIPIDYEIENNGTIEDLYKNIDAVFN